MKRQRQIHPFWAVWGSFFTELQPFGCVQTHSSLRPLQKPASGHPDVGQGEQRDELRGVFLQPAIAHLGVTELPLDDSSLALTESAPGNPETAQR